MQKALRLLKDERLVVGRPGSAVTVREHRQHTLRPAASLAPADSTGSDRRYPWLTEVESLGTRARSRLLDVSEATPPADVAAALVIARGGTALLRSQLLLVDDEPMELATSYDPLELARGTAMTERRRIRGGTPTLLADLGHPPRRSVDRVSARVPTQEQYRALKLPSGLPILRTLRVVYTDDDRPIEATVMAKAGHLYELRYEIAPS